MARPKHGVRTKKQASWSNVKVSSECSGEVNWILDPARRIVRAKVVGDLCGDVLIRHILEVVEHPEVPKPLVELCDCRSIADFEVTRSTIHRIVDLVSRREVFKSSRVAVVADRDVVYGMARMMSLVSEGVGASYEFRPFRALNDAESWLGVEPTPAAPIEH